MLFNSQAFICLFLPVTLAIFFLLGRAGLARGAKLWLILASLFFYGWWNPKFVSLLVASVVVNYLFGIAIGKTRPAPLSRLLLVAAVTVDLTCLAYFKYANFFIANYNHLTHGGLSAVHIVLPLGISFFTFTQIAFLVDVYRGIAVEFQFENYLLFVTYFPHLIAGPILHHKQMMPQFADRETYRVRAENIVLGLTFFCIGLIKKLIIADQLSPYADASFAASEHGAVPLFTAWIGALTYTFQLYFDFSAYCDMAIGISRMFGVRLPLNFNSPYKASSIIDFWRRWHMTLSSFLRDYVYISLGGNRLGKVRRHVNLLATMFLGGLWHGAAWTFVVWGTLHGLLLVVNHLWNDVCQRWSFRPGAWAGLLRSGSIGLTFLCVTVLWVFFRATSFSSARNMLLGMVGATGINLPRGLERFWHAPLQALHVPGVVFDDSAMVCPSTQLHLGLSFLFLDLVPIFVIAFACPNSQELVAKLAAIEWKSPTRTRAMHVAWGLILGIIVCGSLLLVVHKSDFLYFQF